MYSMATAQSTMDFSIMDVDDDVVDSPPNGKNHTKVVHSPSPLKSCPQSLSPWDFFRMNSETQRKLYDEEMVVVAVMEVCYYQNFVFAILIVYLNILVVVDYKCLILLLLAGRGHSAYTCCYRWQYFEQRPYKIRRVPFNI